MKTILPIIAMLVILTACNQQKGISLTNNSSVDLTQKSIELDRSELEQKLGVLPEYSTAFLIDNSKNKYPVQFDDLDGDGKWEVLFSQINIKAGETKHFNLVTDDIKGINILTNIRLADKSNPPQEFNSAKRLKTSDSPTSQATWQMEGVGWENDVVGFRNYFDARNGIDIYGKKTSEMVLDECGLDGGPTYHELQPWGMDILKVGNSLGAGAIAIKTESGLHRIGPDSEGTFKIVKEGALRSIFDLNFEGMSIDNKIISVKHRITIEAGKPYYNSEVWVKGIDGAELVTGIVNLHSDTVYSESNETVSFYYTHDNQAYDGEKLGMAIIVSNNIINVQTAPEQGIGITQTFYNIMPLNNQPVKFYFMAGWEKQDKAYSTIDGFKNAIKKEAEQLISSVEL